ncbi:immunoglobulin lambda-1 light chain [Perca flavescens]|uniref:immunoglobulin lambda-1 light chain n=1 Tax=Perca flavescens TaxID=8167 RepID=UPI00106E4EC9|nr:immunoglobulin lambda-1 light chain-like [Perca flavescens]
MIIIFLCITFRSILVSGSSLSDNVHQTPADTFKKPNEPATISCSHSIPNYDRVLWYKQSKNKKLQFLGYMYKNNGNPEAGLGIKMDGSADKDQTSTLTIEELSLNSSAVYFCAATWSGPGYNPAFFGKGTKLTVLEPGHNITEPTVKVLPPSENECQKQKDDSRKKTLVCVASGFYPDHVTVEWKVNGDKVTNGLATDNDALQVEDKSYRITSRLSVSVEDWFTPGKSFTCIVKFFNGKETISHKATVLGVEAKGEGGMTREYYLKISQTAKLSYALLIIKSSLYGAFVAFLVWKLQRSTGKRSN